MDSLIDFFAQHHDHFFYAVAGILLLLELGVLGISGPLLFVALACIATGLLITLGIISGWNIEFLMVGVFSAVIAMALWKPLKKFQNAASAPDTSSDMIGRELLVTHEITRDQGRVSYSGIEWQARLDASFSESIAISSRVQVVGVDGSLLRVKPSRE
jgi:inner membrane protein